MLIKRIISLYIIDNRCLNLSRNEIFMTAWFFRHLSFKNVDFFFVGPCADILINSCISYIEARTVIRWINTKWTTVCFKLTKIQTFIIKKYVHYYGESRLILFWRVFHVRYNFKTGYKSNIAKQSALDCDKKSWYWRQ